MIYCDTSLLVSAFTEESASDVAVAWLDRQDRRSLSISGWTITEFATAIARKARNGELDDRHRALIDTGWAELRRGFVMIEVTPRHFDDAAALGDVTAKGLRAGDALHLAIARVSGSALATFDHDLADAARTIGVVVHPE